MRQMPPNNPADNAIEARIRFVVAAALAGVLSVGCAAQVAASRQAKAAAVGATEPCFGVARAGKNDCRTSAHVCAGWSRQDRDSAAFIYLPQGTCDKLVGGRTTAT